MVLRAWFPKHNWVKCERRTRLNLDTLDALTRDTLSGVGVEFTNWNGIFESWNTAKRTNKRRALSVQEVKLWFFLNSLHRLETCTIQFTPQQVHYKSCISLPYSWGFTSWI